MEAPWNNTVVIDGVTFVAERDVTVNHQSTFPERQTFGDPTARDQEYLSNWAIRKVPGGLGIEEYDEGTDAERLWWACLDTRYGRGWTLPPLVLATRPSGVPADAVSYPLGIIGTQAYTCFVWTDDEEADHHAVYGFQESDLTWLAVANDLTATPVGKAVAFAGTSTKRVFVPLGANGYAVLAESDPNGTLSVTIAAGASDPDAVAFCMFQVGSVPQLYAIDGNGFLFVSVTTGLTTTWIQPDDGLPSNPNAVRIDASETPKHLFIYQAPDRTKALHCMTDRALWIYNGNIPAFERTHFEMAPHAKNALGLEVWRPGENVHVTQGLERWQYTTGDVHIPGTGPVKDDGVPVRFRGYLSDLEGEVSFLFATLNGSNAGSFSETFVEDAGSNYDDAIYVAPAEAFSALVCDTGLGWHCLWESPSPITLTWAMVAGIDPGYALWFGGDQGDVYRLPLRASFYNARQGALLGLDNFAETGYFITGWFDAAMLNFDKLAHSLSITMAQATATEYLDISYQTDDDEVNWTPLGRVNSSRKTELRFGTDGDGITRGLAFNRVRFMGEMRRGAVTNTSPVFVAMALHFLKIPHDAETFTVQVDLARELPSISAAEGHPEGVMSADEKRAWLKARLMANRFIVFEHARRKHLVLLTRIGGSDATGRDETGVRTLSFLALEELTPGAA